MLLQHLNLHLMQTKLKFITTPSQSCRYSRAPHIPATSSRPEYVHHLAIMYPASM